MLQWAYNGALFGGGLLWLAVMLRALEVEFTLDKSKAFNSGGFWRTFVLGLVLSFGVQDTIKARLLHPNVPA